jgi:hypothetical protein
VGLVVGLVVVFGGGSSVVGLVVSFGSEFW